jgi:hypothetical protein
VIGLANEGEGEAGHGGKELVGASLGEMGLAALRVDLEGIVAGVDEVHGDEGDGVAQCCYEVEVVFLDLANSDRMMPGRRYREYRVVASG